jgi:PAS domain S-box-containing protein
MIIILILTLSILLQFVAAIMAFRLIPLTGKRLAWSLISAALMFMALRRCVPLIHILTGDTTIRPDLNAELIALAISLLMVVGISKIAPIFTDRKRAAAALQQSEAFLNRIIEESPNPMWISDEKGTLIRINLACCKILNITAEEVVGKYNILDDNIVEEQGLLPLVKSVFEEGRTVQFEITYDTPRLKHLALQRHAFVILAVTIFPIRDSNEKITNAVIQHIDITERKRAEEETLNTLKQLQEAKDMLVQSEKLAAIGRLSAGVGHEILNPLNIISMRMQFLEMTEKLPDKVKEGFATMFRQIDRIVKITKDLSQFSRISKRDMVKKDINQLIQHIAALVMPRLRVEQVTLETELPPDLPQTPMDSDRIEQVVLNVINNAVDALDGRENKVIRVTSGLTRREGRDYLRLTISDNGRGIPRENIDKLFDPFFTTKEAGKGTGLGLHICYTIIQEHGGRIWAENNADCGASFFIELPIEEQETKT